MEFLVDTANLEEIKRANAYLPLAGVTSNPSILKKEGKVDLFNHLREIRAIIGIGKTLHVQVTSTDTAGMIADAHRILEAIDDQVYVKVPVNEAGLQAIKQLKAENVNITATAIYTEMQANLAVAAGADYIAPYYNRMENMNIDPCEIIASVSYLIEKGNYPTKILGASYKNVGQVNKSLACGAHAITAGMDIFDQAFQMPAIEKAVSDFSKDWVAIHGEGKEIHDL